MFETLFITTLKLLLVGVLILYGVLVLIALKNKETYELEFDWNDPAHSAERLSVGIGVMAVSLVIRGLKVPLDILEEASADVGEWILHHRNL